MNIYEVYMELFGEGISGQNVRRIQAPEEFIIAMFMQQVMEIARYRGQQRLGVRMRRYEYVDGREDPVEYKLEYKNWDD